VNEATFETEVIAGVKFRATAQQHTLGARLRSTGAAVDIAVADKQR